MKKLLASTLAMTMALSLAACGGGSSENSGGGNAGGTQAAQTEAAGGQSGSGEGNVITIWTSMSCITRCLNLGKRFITKNMQTALWS